MRINLEVLISNKLRYAYRSKYTGPSVEEIRKDMNTPPSAHHSYSVVVLSSITDDHIGKDTPVIDNL